MQTRRGKKHDAAKGATKTKDKTRRPVKVMDVSHTDSTTQQTESWDCPISTRKHFIPDKVVISSRRASLRSSKRFIETRITSSPCSQPQKKSKKHSSNTDEVPKMRQEESKKVEKSVSQVDIPRVMEDEVGEAEKEPLEETIPKAYHVSEGSLVAHPLTLEPEMRHEETEKIGSSVADQEKVSEAEDSFLNFLYQMEGQNKLDTQCILLEKEPQASNNNHRKSTSTVAFSSPSFKLTEMVNNIMLDHEDVEVDSITLDTVDGYLVKPELMPILREIISKHGDIARNCTAVAMKERSSLLEMICIVISELQEKEYSEMSEDFLRRQIAVVNHLKNMKVETEWLHLRLVDILEARKILNQCGKHKQNKDSNRKTLENAKRKLKECREQQDEIKTKLESLLGEKTICTGTLEREMDESKRIDEITIDVASKVRPFLNYSAVDDLL